MVVVEVVVTSYSQISLWLMFPLGTLWIKPEPDISNTF